jgi:Uma2 family endonuclease
MAKAKTYTADDLWLMPEDAPYELWRGAMVEVPPTAFESSAVAVRIGARIADFVAARELGVVTGAGGGYILFANEQTVVAPDVGFIQWERLPGRKPTEQYCPVPPDLAIEVTSPYDEPGNLGEKLDLYLEAGVRLVWWVDLGKRVVRVHRPGKPVEVLGEGDVLDGEDVLPSFRLPVADIFAE